MKLFHRYLAPEASVWPARQRAIAYVQLGDLVEMWVHRKQARFAACEFCQTVNHQSDGRCHTCGSALPVRDEAEPDLGMSTSREKARGKARPSAARSLGNVMRLATLPPLMLFVGFVAWYQMRESAAERPAVTATAPAAPRTRVQAVRAPPTLAPGDLGLSAGEVLLPSPQAASVIEKQPEAEAVPATATAVQTDNGPAPKARRAAAQASARQDPDPLAACGNSNFFARAICVNSRCADPKTAHLGQCREAIRQRQIDEARRNPSLMG